MEEDESYQKRYGSRWSRLPSHLANQELLAKAQHFSTVLEQAQDSDRKVKAMWKEWSAAIEALTSDEVLSILYTLSSLSKLYPGLAFYASIFGKWHSTRQVVSTE